MKKVTQYKCELCGTLYADQTDCEACEKQHKVPCGIIKILHMIYCSHSFALYPRWF